MLTTLLPFIKVLAAFTIMLFGVRFRLSLGLSILCGAWTLGIFFKIGPKLLGLSTVHALLDPQFIFLALIVGLILMLSNALKDSGQSQRLMDALSGYLKKPRLRLIFFPALIGLLPMPGGAVFSAPMIQSASQGMGLSGRQQTLINYWFRHIWELAWPLYPGIILTVALAEIPVSTFIFHTWPAVVFMIGIGWFFFLRPKVLHLSPKAIKSTPPSGGGIKEVLYQGLPLILAIAGAVGLEVLISGHAPNIPFETGVIIAMLAAVLVVMIQNRLGLHFLWTGLRQKNLWSMLLVIAAVFVFKEIMEQASVVEAMAQAAGKDAALFAASVFLPFFVGMISGINVAFVGSTFPLLLGLIQTLGMEEQTLPLIILASFAGFTGVMISPLHICFILTCQFFHADPAGTWRKLIAPCLVLAVLGALLVLFQL